MRNFIFVIGLTALGACARTDALDARKGSDVAVQQQDGVVVEGRLVEVLPDNIVIEKRDGVRTTVPRSQVKSLRETSAVAQRRPAEPPAPDGSAATEREARDTLPADGKAPGGGKDAAPPDDSAAYRDVTIPAGTTLSVELRTPVGSDTSHIEDPVRGALRRPVMINGLEALPVGTTVMGHVTSATRSARVKGRAKVAIRFDAIDPPGPEGRAEISTATVSRVAPATKKQDAAKIGAGAAGGAIVGGILGGGGGAAKGAVIGGGAGTAVVMSTRGKEVRLNHGAPLTVKLTAPLVVRVRQG